MSTELRTKIHVKNSVSKLSRKTMKKAGEYFLIKGETERYKECKTTRNSIQKLRRNNKIKRSI
jgi:hypothetical protein